jgi:hypothetical protein
MGLGGNAFIGGNLILMKDASLNGNLNISGKVFIANATSSSSINTGALVVNGGVGVNGTVNATIFNSISDYRIKTNIKPITSTVDNLKPVHYYNIKSEKEDMGFIAHEVQEIFPFLVYGIKDDTDIQSINYNGFIALLTKEVKELKKENQELKSRLSHIESILFSGEKSIK